MDTPLHPDLLLLASAAMLVVGIALAVVGLTLITGSVGPVQDDDVMGGGA
jgi:hypothetical protein